MNFLQKIKASIYGPQFYREIPQKSFGSALGYFLLFILLLIGVQALFFIKPLFVDFPSVMRGYVQKVVEQFPQDLSVTITDGKLSTTVEEPYFIPIPKDGSEDDSETVTNLVVIDTRTPYSVEQFNTYNSVMWVTGDSVFVKSDKETKTIELTQVPDVTIDKSFAGMIGQKIMPFLSFVGPVLFLLAIVALYLFYLTRLFYLLILSLLILLIAKIAKLQLTYSGIYKIGLYAMTLAFIVDLIVSKSSGQTGFTGISFMFSIITLGVIVLNYRQESGNTPPPSKVVTQAPKKRKKI